MGQDQPQDRLLTGMEVHDVEGNHVGKVMRFEKKLGYFETVGVFSGPRYIPFWAIDHFGPAGVYLNVTRSVVTDVYQHFPEVTPDVNREGKLTGTGKIQSGRTGKMVPLDANGVREVRERVHPGVEVIDADAESIGRVESYDPASGYMRVERNGLLASDVFLPVTSVSYLDEEGIHLSDDKQTLLRRFNQIPEVARPFFGR